MTEKLVIIGNGMAPGGCWSTCSKPAPGRYEVTIFNAEPRVNYDRIMLSPVLSGEKDFEEIIIHGDGWYIKQRHHALQGPQDRRDRPRGEDRHLRPWRHRALRQAGHRHRLGALHHPGAGPRSAGRAHLSRSRRRQRHAARRTVARPRPWSSAAACLGSKPRPGSNARHGRHRAASHADPDGAPARSRRRLSAAARGRSARHQGHHQGQHQGDHRQRQGRGRRACTTARIIPADARGHGRRHPAELRAGQGGRASTVNRGIVVDAGMRTSDPDIFALGECAEVGGQVYGLVAPLYEMARVAAAQLAGDATAALRP